MSETSQEVKVTIGGVIFAFLIESMMPIVVCFSYIKYYRCRLVYIIIGMIGFFISSVIEGIFMFITRSIFGKSSTIFLVTSFLSAGIFHQLISYYTIKFLTSKDANKSKRLSLNNGVGRGAVECFVLAFSFLANLFRKKSLNYDITFIMCLMNILERAFIYMMHISLSVLIFKQLMDKKKIYFIIAVAVNDAIVAIPIFRNKQVMYNYLISECFIGLIVIGISIYAYNLYQKIFENFDEKEDKIPFDKLEKLENKS